MKKIITSLSLCIFCFTTLIAQVTDKEKDLRSISTDTVSGWKFGNVSSINFSQTHLSNWAAGGENSLALNGMFSAFAKYKSGKNTWDNTLDIGYGLLKQGKGDDIPWTKTDDKIEISSKYGRKAFSDIYYAALVNFKTQFAPGYNNPDERKRISDFLAPAYFLGGLGLNYQPNSSFSMYLSPVTGRITYVNDTILSTNFGLESGAKTRTEFGGYLRINYSKNDFKQEFLKNIGIASKLDLFSNYLENPENVDVSWETLIAFKLNKYISVNLNMQLIYDDDVKFEETLSDGTTKKVAKLQFKEILGIGFSYKL